MKKVYETPKAEKMVFDYTDVIVTSGGITDKNPNKGCTVTESGQSMHGKKNCPGNTKNNKC